MLTVPAIVVLITGIGVLTFLLTSLTSKLDLLQQTLRNETKWIKDFRASQDNANSSIQRLNSQSKSLNSTNAILLDKIRQVDSQLRSLNNTGGVLADKIKQMSSQLESLNSTHVILLEKVRHMDSQLNALNRTAVSPPSNVTQNISDSRSRSHSLSSTDKTVVIDAVFTQAAYQAGSWYDNKGVTTVSLNYGHDWRTNFGGAVNGVTVLNNTGLVDTVTDIYLTNHPEILKAYHRVIVLHNEYVTKAEYDAIMNHSNVFYAYPNALYRLVNFTGSTVTNGGTITLLGLSHNPYANSTWGDVSEFDRCSNHAYKVVKYPNGAGLSCYPERELWGNRVLVEMILGQKLP